MKRINSREELQTLAAELGVRPDWINPDEQNVTVSVHGTVFDNTGFWPQKDYIDDVDVEHHAVINQAGTEVAVVNLADLFAWATR